MKSLDPGAIEYLVQASRSILHEASFYSVAGTGRSLELQFLSMSSNMRNGIHSVDADSVTASLEKLKLRDIAESDEGRQHLS